MVNSSDNEFTDDDVVDADAVYEGDGDLGADGEDSTDADSTDAEGVVANKSQSNASSWLKVAAGVLGIVVVVGAVAIGVQQITDDPSDKRSRYASKTDTFSLRGWGSDTSDMELHVCDVWNDRRCLSQWLRSDQRRTPIFDKGLQWSMSMEDPSGQMRHIGPEHCVQEPDGMMTCTAFGWAEPGIQDMSLSFDPRGPSGKTSRRLMEIPDNGFGHQFDIGRAHCTLLSSGMVTCSTNTGSDSFTVVPRAGGTSLSWTKEDGTVIEEYWFPFTINELSELPEWESGEYGPKDWFDSLDESTLDFENLPEILKQLGIPPDMLKQLGESIFGRPLEDFFEDLFYEYDDEGFEFDDDDDYGYEDGYYGDGDSSA